MSIHFPTEMHIAQRKLPATSPKAVLLRMLSAFFICVAIAGIIGNVYGVKVRLASQLVLYLACWQRLHMHQMCMRCLHCMTVLQGCYKKRLISSSEQE